MKRRWLIGLLAVIALGTPAFAAGTVDRCAGARDLKFVNGKIVTMDKRNTVLSEVAIQNGLVAAAGTPTSSCTKVINLRGRTAIPGNVLTRLAAFGCHDLRVVTPR